MIANRERTTVLSSLGWVEGDAIWCFDVDSGTVRTIPQNTGARYTSLHASDTERFVAVHHFDGSRFLASVSLFSAPEITVSATSYENGRTSLTGNAAEGLTTTFSSGSMPAIFIFNGSSGTTRRTTRGIKPWSTSSRCRIRGMRSSRCSEARC
jgi:hypothetical protein